MRSVDREVLLLGSGTFSLSGKDKNPKDLLCDFCPLSLLCMVLFLKQIECDGRLLQARVFWHYRSGELLEVLRRSAV